MNKLILKKINNDVIIYSFQPEGNADAGEVTYDLKEQTAFISKPSKGYEASHYSYKAVRKVEELVKENRFPKEVIQAWY